MNKCIIYIYLRVSTAKQTIDSQKLEIDRYLEKNNLINDTQKIVWVEEIASGFKISYKKRKIGVEIIPLLKEGDLVIAFDLSRFGRNMDDTISCLIAIREKKATAYLVTGALQVVDNSMMSRMMVQLLSMTAENERENIVSRVKAGIAKALLNGVHFGAPNRLIGRKELILERLRNKVKQTDICKELGCKPTHLNNFISRYKLKDELLSKNNPKSVKIDDLNPL